jgi:hypothetical protein
LGLSEDLSVSQSVQEGDQGVPQPQDATVTAVEAAEQSIQDQAFEQGQDGQVPSKNEEGDDRAGKTIQSTGMDIIFEAHAPKIIVPENSTPTSGFLLLDTGYLEVRGSMGPQGMTWDVSLRDVNAGMPKAVEDMYDFGQQSLYLIKVGFINILQFLRFMPIFSVLSSFVCAYVPVFLSMQLSILPLVCQYS